MSEVADPEKTHKEEIKKAVEAERVRILTLLVKNIADKAAQYKAHIRHTGGLLTQSMVFAYSKGFQESIKLITKESTDEKFV